MVTHTDERPNGRPPAAPSVLTTQHAAQARDRYAAIGEWLAAEGRIDVVDMATRLGVAQETIRRDLRTLERTGKLVRVHGGAVRVDAGPLAIRPLAPPADPDETDLAQRVWRLLPRRGTILVGTGQLSLALAHAMVATPPDEPGMTVVTNSLDAAVVLSRTSRLEVYNIGGTVSPVTRAQEGDWAVHELGRLHVDVSVVCPAGVSTDRGLTQATPAAASVSQAEVACADRVLVLAGPDSLGTSAFVQFATLEQVQLIAVVGRPGPDALQPFLERGIEIDVKESS